MLGRNLIKENPIGLRSEYASIRIFKSYLGFQNYYAKVIERLTEEWRKYLETNRGDAAYAFENRSDEDERNYGFPLPKDMEDALARIDYMNMPLFKERYDELYPFMAELEKKSTAIIDRPKMVFSDREIGMFSLQRFMMGLYPQMSFYSAKKKEFIEPKLVLYSPKHKKVLTASEVIRNIGSIFYTKDKSEVIEKLNIVTNNKNGENSYTLLEDGSALEYKQLQKDGNDQWATKNKKVFFLKQLVNKPFKSIRIFISIGANWGQDVTNKGIAAVSVAVFLESLGYAVRLTGVKCSYYGYGRKNHITGKSGVNGYRVSVFDMKGYSETLDLSTTLYSVADPSCFRVKFFDALLAEQFDYDDDYDAGLGQMASGFEMKNLIISMMKKREIDFEADTLYYFMGGSEINSIEDAKNQIEDIVLQSEEENRRALEETKISTL